MELLTDLKRTSAALCDCGFLYFSRDMITASLTHIYQRPAEAHRLKYLMAAAGDTTRLLVAGGAPEDVVKEHESELREIFEDAIVKPLCREIETDLRLHLHSVRLVGAVEVNPARTGVRALGPFLKLGSIRRGVSLHPSNGSWRRQCSECLRPPSSSFPCYALSLRCVSAGSARGRSALAPSHVTLSSAMTSFTPNPRARCGRWRVDVAASVSRFLNASFHNHCAVALHDWKTYGEMRCLARDKYGAD